MKAALIGSKTLAVRVLEELRQHADLTAVVTVADEDDPRSRLDDLAAQGAIVAHSRAEAVRLTRSLDADLVVVAGWYWLIPADELRRRRFVGIHHSLLPAYRGGSPLVWALIEGRDIVGTSLFALTDEMDAGPIWAQAPVPVLDGYIGDVQARCDDAAIALLPRLLDGLTEPAPQDASVAFSRPSRKPSDGLIDWTRPAAEVVRWIRAQSRPYPGAFTFREGERLTIWRASTHGTRSGSPGDVQDGTVTCGDGRSIVIEEASGSVAGGDRLRSGDVAGVESAMGA
jgi:methionyl-tRNA formyltransferase